MMMNVFYIHLKIPLNDVNISNSTSQLWLQAVFPSELMLKLINTTNVALRMSPALLSSHTKGKVSSWHHTTLVLLAPVWEGCQCLLWGLQEQAEKNVQDKFEHTLSKSAKSCLRTSETGNFKYSANSSIPILPPLEELAIEAYSSKCLRMPSQSNLNREL